MRKFLVIVKKEIRELLTIQVLLGMLVTVLLFAFLGNVIRDEGRQIQKKQNISIIDLDKTATSKETISALSKAGFRIKLSEDGNLDAAIKIAAKNDIVAIVAIPSGFERNLIDSKQPGLDVYGVMSGFSFAKMTGSAVDRIRETINESLSSKMIRLATDGKDLQKLKTPARIKDHVVVRDKTAAISTEEISGFIMSQTAFVPIILFAIIMIATQMTANAIASEKENKTLETLLSVPIDRRVLVLAKMVAAGLLALAAAIFYMFVFKFWMENLTEGAVSAMAAGPVGKAIRELGLTLSPSNYAILGIVLFFTILCALSISTILGALAENAKGVQSLLMPLMILVMMPYLLSMFTDIGTLSPIPRYLMYAIPFTHAFTAMPNIYAGNYQAIFYGILYEAAFFAFFVYIAGRIFSSDKILTLKLRVRKRISPIKTNLL
jgi:ABC-2 type transport system permease protein